MIEIVGRPPNPHQLNRLAAIQHGALTRGQLLRLGANDQWIYSLLQAGNLIEIEGDVYLHHAYDTHYDDFDRSVWFAAEPTALPEEKLRKGRTPHLILTGPRALSIQHLAPTGGPVIFACEALPEVRSPAHDFVVRPIRSGEWEWVRGVPIARRTFAIADMILADDDEDSITTALIDAIASNDLAATALLDTITPALRSWGLDPTDRSAALRRFLPRDVVMHYATGTTAIISLDRNGLKVNSETPIDPTIRGLS